MSEYTDEQAQAFYAALEGVPAGTDGSAHWGQRWLRKLHDAGITVTFPEPQYEVVHYAVSIHTGWMVRDREDGRLKAWFGDDLIGAENDARELADQLNRETQR